MKNHQPIPREALPRIVSREEWQRERDALLVKEKEETRRRDALAAERRRLPMVLVEKDYVFDGPDGDTRLIDLFAGRDQLALYHFMFAPGVCGWPDAGCPGCSMFIDNRGSPLHLQARDVSFAAVSLAPLENLQRYKERMGWDFPWVSSANNSFNRDFGVTTEEGEDHGLSIFLRDGDKVYHTYFSSRRGLETVASNWGFLDLTPFGRQEPWEDTPSGRPQSPPYEWWERHDEY